MDVLEAVRHRMTTSTFARLGIVFQHLAELQRASPLILPIVICPPTLHTFLDSNSAMAEGLFYNVSNGYVEGIVRGYRNTLLTGQAYGNLTQCETIDGKTQ
jgi:hypothetical protein